MAGGNRTSEKIHIISRRSKIAAMLLMGITNQFEIAARLGMEPSSGQKTVSRDIMWIRNEWRLQAIQDWGEFVGRELAVVDKLEKEAWEAWERSCKSRKRTRSSVKLAKRDDSQMDETSEQIAHEERDGDPRFLDIVMTCIDKRCKLLQLELKSSKERAAQMGPNKDGKASTDDRPSVEEFKKLPMEERVRILMNQRSNN